MLLGDYRLLHSLPWVLFYNVTVYALYLESFCVENPLVRKFFAFSDSGRVVSKEVSVLVVVNVNWLVEIIS